MIPSTVDWKNYHKRWDNAWMDGNGQVLQACQMFDQGQSSPMLTKILQDQTIQVKNKSVFVPGCGRGYDLIEFNKQGANKCVGLEISRVAVQEANNYIKLKSKQQHENIKVIEGDFFQENIQERYDVGYDYTFFCALHPEMRLQWGIQWAKHLKPGGTLICIMFPVSTPENISKNGFSGPPWPVNKEAYNEALSEHFRLQFIKEIASELSISNRQGKEMIGIYVNQ